jgi:hypothetical protein
MAPSAVERARPLPLTRSIGQTQLADWEAEGGATQPEELKDGSLRPTLR